jgi:hypothetical protein
MTTENGPDETLSPSESLDSDEVRNSDGDTVVDPPQDWSVASRHPGPESLDDKLAQEAPDSAEPSATESAESGKVAEVVDGVIVEDSRVHRGQVDGSAEDGDSLFPIE